MRKVLDTILWIILIVIAGFYLYGLLATSNSAAVKSFLVQSGSMEPTIMTGDIIFVKPQPSYIENQVVTFSDSKGRTVTHRITDIKDGSYQTKGDANQSKDIDTIAKEQIIGKVVFTLPKAGYLVSFSKTPLGFALFIVVPIVLLLYSEIANTFFKKKTNKTTKPTNSIL